MAIGDRDWSLENKIGLHWDDLKFPASGNRLDSAATRYRYDFDELAIIFDDDARKAEEVLGHIAQMEHAWAEESTLKPHIHWIQSQAAVPNWLIEYRRYNNGEIVPAFVAAASLSSIFTYVSGSILQISTFPDINMAGMRISSFVDVKITRDTANSSGLFAGADPVTGGVSFKEFDFHAQNNSRGSLQEYIK